MSVEGDSVREGSRSKIEQNLLKTVAVMTLLIFSLRVTAGYENWLLPY